MGAPPPYSPSREKEQAAPKHAGSSCRQASSVSQQHQQQQQQTQSQYQNQYQPFLPPPPPQQQPFLPYTPQQALFQPPPTRPASSLANYDPRGSISGVRSSNSTPQ